MSTDTVQTPKCQKCGNNGFSSPTCTQCGTQLIQPPKCVWCNTEIHIKDSHCPGCDRDRHSALNIVPEPISFAQFFNNLRRFFW